MTLFSFLEKYLVFIGPLRYNQIESAFTFIKLAIMFSPKAL